MVSVNSTIERGQCMRTNGQLRQNIKEVNLGCTARTCMYVSENVYDAIEKTLRVV